MIKALNANVPANNAVIPRALRMLALVAQCCVLLACATHPEATTDPRPVAGGTAEAGAVTESARQGQAKAIASYSDYLARYPHSPEYDQVARRLADLLLERAADRQVAMHGMPEQSTRLQAAASRDYAEAIKLYEQLLSKDPGGPQSTALLYQLSRAYQDSGRDEEALNAINRLLAQASSNDRRLYADTRFRQGELLFSRGAYAEAAQSYQAVVELGESMPAYEQSLYKLGWSLFKQDRYRDALPYLFAALDHKVDPASSYEAQLEVLAPADREQVEDLFRVISNSFAQLGGAQSVNAYFRQSGRRSYESAVYLALADWYVNQDQVGDAVETWLALARKVPMDEQAPRLLARGIDLYRQAGFQQRLSDLEAVFVTTYGLGSEFWSVHSTSDFPQVLQSLRDSLEHLALTSSAEAARTGETQSVQAAEHWFRLYLASFGEDAAAAQMNFQLAELLYQHGRYREALDEYERAAWSYAAHPLVADAALGAQHAGDALLQNSTASQQRAISERSARGARRFVKAFPDHPAAPGLLVRTGSSLLEQQQHAAALNFSEDALAATTTSTELRQVAWSLRAQALFGLQNYPESAAAYEEALQLAALDDARRDALREGLAIATYKQAEQLLAQGDKAGAAAVYQRAAALAPDDSVGARAIYDAASTLLALESWTQAIELLEHYRENYPQDSLEIDVSRKLAYALAQRGDSAVAADEYLELGRDTSQPETLQREALFRAVELYLEAGRPAQAISAGELYVQRFPQPAAPAIDLIQQLAKLQAGNPERQEYWLNTVIRLDRAAGGPHTREQAAEAALALANMRLEAFRRVRLTAPVQVHLAQKVDAMKRALKAYESAIDYGVAAVSESSTMHIAGMYDELAAALLSSERPAGLTQEELAEYDGLLFQQAAAFERQATDIYRSSGRFTGGGEPRHPVAGEDRRAHGLPLDD